jgi:hypothetical protein
MGSLSSICGIKTCLCGARVYKRYHFPFLQFGHYSLGATRMRLCRTDQSQSSPFKSRLRQWQMVWSFAFEDDSYAGCIPLVAVRFCCASCFLLPHPLFVQALHGQLSSQSNC